MRQLKKSHGVWPAAAAVATAGVVAVATVMMAMASGGALPVAGANAADLDNPVGRWLKPSITAIWYNAYAERWDGVLPIVANESSGEGGHWLATDLRSGSPTYQFAMDTRSAARPDVWWDESKSRLHVVFGHSFQSLAYVLHYDVGDDNYTIDKRLAGVPIPGMVGDSDDSPLATIVTPNGYWWAARTLPDGLLINRSTDGGASWLGSPVNLSEEVAHGATTLTSFRGDEVDFLHLFSSENEGGSWRAYVIAADAPDIHPENWVDETHCLPSFHPGEAGSDDHGTARAFRDHIYIATKVEVEEGENEPIVLLHRNPEGIYTRYDVVPRDNAGFRPTRPSLAIDEDNESLYLTYGSIQSFRLARTRYLPDFAKKALHRVGIGRKAMARYKIVSIDALHTLDTTREVIVFQEESGFNSVITPRHPINSASQLLLIAAQEGLVDIEGHMPIFVDILEIVQPPAERQLAGSLGRRADDALARNESPAHPTKERSNE